VGTKANLVSIIFSERIRMDDLERQKVKLRAHYLTSRNKIPYEYRQRQSFAVCKELEKIAIHSNTKVIHGFIPFGSEVNILPFLQFCLENKIKVITPKIRKRPKMQHLVTSNLNDLKRNKFGIKETTSNIHFDGTYDIILVPGTVFDQCGYRVGYGGGYYDYFLSHQSKVLKIGVGFPLQYTKQLPVESHDIAVDLLVLGTRVIELK